MEENHDEAEFSIPRVTIGKKLWHLVMSVYR